MEKLQMAAVGPEQDPGQATTPNRTAACSSPAPVPFLDDAAAAAIAASEAAAETKRRIRASGVPARYLPADLNLCDPQIQDYARGLDEGNARGLLIRGNVGVGKTYSGCAVLLHAAARFCVRFATLGDVLAEIKGTFNSRSMNDEADVIGKYVNTRLLMLDDLGKEKPTAFALEKLFAIVDRRYRDKKPTIYTTQYESYDLIERLAKEGDIETAKAIVSRLCDCVPVVLDGPDRRIGQ